MKTDRKTVVKDIVKFLCGAFFVTAGASWWFYSQSMPVPFYFGMTMSPEFLGVRGFIHFGFFLASLYYGFIRK